MVALRSRRPLFIPFLVALVGVLFSVWNALDAESVPCITSGCTLYHDLSIGGFSLWWMGTAAFSLMGIIALFNNVGLGRFVSSLILFLDCVLLVVMALTLPCLVCLVEAVLFVLCCMAFRMPDIERRERPIGMVSPVIFCWIVLFIVNLGLMLHLASSPWAIRESALAEDATTRIFFSPSCSACRRLVENISELEARRASWYPVAEREQDLAVIFATAQLLESTSMPLAEALKASYDAPPLGVTDMLSPQLLLLQFRLWCNQARVLSANGGVLPLVEFDGLPVGLIKPSALEKKTGTEKKNTQATEESTNYLLPLELQSEGSCSGKNASAPCD